MYSKSAYVLMKDHIKLFQGTFPCRLPQTSFLANTVKINCLKGFFSILYLGRKFELMFQVLTILFCYIPYILTEYCCLETFTKTWGELHCNRNWTLYRKLLWPQNKIPDTFQELREQEKLSDHVHCFSRHFVLSRKQLSGQSSNYLRILLNFVRSEIFQDVSECLECGQCRLQNSRTLF